VEKAAAEKLAAEEAKKEIVNPLGPLTP